MKTGYAPGGKKGKISWGKAKPAGAQFPIRVEPLTVTPNSLEKKTVARGTEQEGGVFLASPKKHR